jgi:integrase
MPLKLTQRHGSPYWYIRGSIRGCRVDESTGVGDRKTAEEILLKRSSELLERSIHGDALSRTFAEAALSYLEQGGEKAHLAPLIRHFGTKKLAAIGQHEIEEAAKKLCPGRAPATVNRRIFTPTVAVLHHAARKKWCAKPAIGRPRQPQGRIRWITAEEARKLADAAAPHLKPLLTFLLATGARLSEALYLDWSDVDLSRCHVTFRPTKERGIKNGEARGVPLHPRAVAALANLSHREGSVFRRPDGEPYEVREGGGGQIKTAWAGMCRRAGVSDFTPHDCRHTWASWHYAANRDVLALMKLGGWKSLAMVERYAHVNTAEFAPGINRMWEQAGNELPAISPTSGPVFTNRTG